MRLRELERALLDWQATLGLLDWEIEVLLVRPDDLPGQLGQLEYNLESRQAVISIVRGKKNQLATLVHELLHCWTRQIREARRADLVEEQALEAIGGAIMQLSGRT